MEDFLVCVHTVPSQLNSVPLLQHGFHAGWPRGPPKTLQHDLFKVTDDALSVFLKIVLVLARLRIHKHILLCILLLTVYIFL